jgi:hypothetical protein
VPSIAAVQPVHVATYIEQLAQDHWSTTVKARLAAIRHLFVSFITHRGDDMSWSDIGEIIKAVAPVFTVGVAGIAAWIA